MKKDKAFYGGMITLLWPCELAAFIITGAIAKKWPFWAFALFIGSFILAMMVGGLIKKYTIAEYLELIEKQKKVNISQK